MLNKRIELSLQIGVERTLIGALQLPHFRWTVGDFLNADARSTGVYDNRYARIIDNDDLRRDPMSGVTLGVDLEYTVRQIFVVDVPIIKKSRVGVMRF